MLFFVNVTEGHDHINVEYSSSTSTADDSKLQSLLHKYKHRFPADLPAKLPPERNVYHTFH